MQPSTMSWLWMFSFAVMTAFMWLSYCSFFHVYFIQNELVVYKVNRCIRSIHESSLHKMRWKSKISIHLFSNPVKYSVFCYWLRSTGLWIEENPGDLQRQKSIAEKLDQEWQNCGSLTGYRMDGTGKKNICYSHDNSKAPEIKQILKSITLISI